MNVLPAVSATALLSALTVSGFAAVLGHITLGFEHWTFEARRHALVQRGALAAPDLARHAQSPQRVLIVDFIATRCPSVCRVLGSEYQQMQTALRSGGVGSVGLLSVGIDPLHDHPAALAAYALEHGADPALWGFVAPIDARQAAAQRRDLGVVAVPDGFGGYVHNTALHLIDAQGSVRALYPYSDWRRALAHAQALAAAP